MIVLGIDPGLSGGWACIESDEDDTLRAPVMIGSGRMPKKAYGKKQMADGGELYRAIRKSKGNRLIDVAIIEHVHAMPAQGVSSSFSFGMNTGVAHGIAAMFTPELITVTPQEWKKHHDLQGSDKRQSLDLAFDLFPLQAGWGVLVNDGIAEAALMALWYIETTRDA